ncbi:MAG TPA: DUF2752 domain-containing protein [Candidatus Korarchaeota archaeon]|nr:DUF2752 domain-containing protein [Candidatus Korarchaeota archaeon]
MDLETEQRLIAVLLSSFLLLFATVVPMEPGQEELSFPWIACPYKSMTGRPCPLCGSTRAFIHTAHGNLSDAWRLNPIGMIAYFGVWALLIYEIYMLLIKHLGRLKI